MKTPVSIPLTNSHVCIEPNGEVKITPTRYNKNRDAQSLGPPVDMAPAILTKQDALQLVAFIAANQSE